MKFITTFFFLLISLQSSANVSEFFLMGRKYVLVTPNKALKAAAPLVVLLHGCKQDSELIMNGTRLKEAAEKNNFFLLIPQQEVFYNIERCWNWFYSINQTRHVAGEMGQIVSTIEAIKSGYAIDSNSLYVIGMSAGGAMAHNFLACYPDYFKGIAVHSGLAFKVAEDPTEANDVLTSTNLKSPTVLGKLAAECSEIPVKNHKLKRLIVIHGQKDPRVNPVHANLIMKATEVMMKNLSFGIPSKLISKLVMVPDLAHAWGGGVPLSPNFDEKAPSSTDAILNFFGLQK